MRIEIRSDHVILDGYVNAVGRDSRPFIFKGKKIVEQIRPGVFKRAIEKAKNLVLLLNHEEDRVLASFEKRNLEAYEDNIGLRCICTITDPEIVEKARKKELRGWSFGFVNPKDTYESMPNGMERRFIDEMELDELTLVDNRKLPVYIGTSVECRAEDELIEEFRGEEFRAVIVDNSDPETIDYSKFDSRLAVLSSEK